MPWFSRCNCSRAHFTESTLFHCLSLLYFSNNFIQALNHEVEAIKREKSRVEATLVSSSEASTKLESTARERDDLAREKQVH